MTWLGRLLSRDGGEKREEKDDPLRDGETAEERARRQQAQRGRADLLRRQDEARLRLLRIEGDIRRRAPGGE